MLTGVIERKIDGSTSPFDKRFDRLTVTRTVLSNTEGLKDTSPERSRGTLTINPEPFNLLRSLEGNAEPVEAGHSRRIDYLRISVTDRCNLRCIYCMPSEGIQTVNQTQLLSFEEITRLVRIFASLGIKIIRFTGGEPLVRKGIVELIKHLNQVKGIEELALTTNGTLLSQYAWQLKEAGISKINVSLDTLKEERFRKITAGNYLYPVLEGIEKIKKLGFSLLKLNVVILKGINDDEIVDFVKFALKNNFVLRFIEFMKVTPLWNEDFFLPIEEVIDICNKEFGLKKAGFKSAGPAQYYQIKDGMIGFIKTSTYNCRICSRMRLTSTGELRLCLYQSCGISLRDLLRRGADDHYIRKVIKSLICLKEDVDFKRWQRPQIYMSSVGG